MGKTTTGLINVENRHAKPNSTIADEELHIVTFNSSFLGYSSSEGNGLNTVKQWSKRK
jgi:uncharacterized protein YhfF